MTRLLIPMDGTANSINQLKVINTRIHLFNTYYQSRVFYSDDWGQTRTHWFQSFWSHRYQIYPCGSDFYIHGIAGDGFRAFVTKIPDNYYGMQNINTSVPIGGCHNSGTECCYYAPPNTTIPEVATYFKNLFETTICNSLDLNEVTKDGMLITPNPSENLLNIEGIDGAIPFEVSIYNALGQQKLKSSNSLQLNASDLESGIYFLKIIQSNSSVLKKIIKK